MKKTSLLIIIISCIFSQLCAQEYLEDVSYISDNVVNKKFGIPIIRNTYGGTKITVTFEGNWSYDMRGAFEYACRIWEEAMPTTFPIRIKAVLDETQSRTELSKIQNKVFIHLNDSLTIYPFSGRSTVLQIKGTKYHEFTGADTQTYDNIITKEMFIEDDIIITYYNKDNRLVNNCSFSLDENIASNLYDFVTLVLRDLAKSFGLVWSSKRVTNEMLRIDTLRLTPFEKNIILSLDANNDLHQAYLNATNGEFTVSANGNSWKLYAPTIWDTERSLNYFIPDSTKKITELLSYEFGRGCVIRDISCDNNLYLFRSLLHWTGDYAVGMESSGCGDEYSSTSDVIPYMGNINITTGTVASNNIIEYNYLSETESVVNNSDLLNDSLLLYLNKFHPTYRSDGSIKTKGWTVALLLKDGTWDIVYTMSDAVGTLDVNFDEFITHYDLDEYARSSDGYLRCRVTDYRFSPVYNKVMGTSYHMIINYLPQRVKMMKSKTLPDYDNTDYYEDIVVAIKDLEGVTRVIVTQINDGDELGYDYEVPDFKKGYFSATVDNEFITTFVITAYNKNGSTVSYPYVYDPLEGRALSVNFVLNDDNITIENNSRRYPNNSFISSYEILPIDMNISRNIITNFSLEYNNKIDVSSLPNGHYILIVYDNRGDKHTFKFKKS